MFMIFGHRDWRHNNALGIGSATRTVTRLLPSGAGRLAPETHGEYHAYEDFI